MNSTPESRGSGQAAILERRPGVPHPVDVYVGSRVRLRRTLLGLSQERLGEAVGLTFQQIQKYERGANRIGASRMYDLAQVLDVPVAYFFEEMPEGLLPQRKAGSEFAEPPQEEMERDPLTRRETLELVRAYYKITNARVRKRVFELVKSIAKIDEFE